MVSQIMSSVSQTTILAETCHIYVEHDRQRACRETQFVKSRRFGKYELYLCVSGATSELVHS